MSDSETKPKRPWFRFHLLTAVLLMIGAGGVLGMNIQHPETIKFRAKGSNGEAVVQMKEVVGYEGGSAGSSIANENLD